MPIYDYRCNSCGKTYDVFHKVREVIEDVICPWCESRDHTRLLSAPNVAIPNGSYAQADSSCSTDGGCCGGACGVD
jgi:putative FmdB family regulatory protein